VKAAILLKPGVLEVREIETPKYEDNEVLVRVKRCGICGSDISRVWEASARKYPIVLGHEFSGDIYAIGKGVKSSKLKKGDKVTVMPCIPCKKCRFCLEGKYFHCTNYNFLGSRRNGAFAEFINISYENVVPLSKGISYEEGIFLEPLSVSLHALKKVGNIIGKDIAIFGLGTIGNLIAQWVKLMGARKIFCVEIIKKRVNIAKLLNLGKLISPYETKVVETIFDNTEGEGVDVAIECSGSIECTEQAFEVAKKTGSVLIIGWIWGKKGNSVINTKIFENIVRKELQVFGSIGYDSNLMVPRSWEFCINCLYENKISVEPLITHSFKLDDVEHVFKMILEGKEEHMKILLEL